MDTNKREKLLQYNRQYNMKNREKINAQMREFNKEYYKKNKAKIIEYQLKRLKLKSLDRVTCECGTNIMRSYLKQHLLTQKHKTKSDLMKQ